MTNKPTQDALKQLSLGLAAFGFCAGFLLSYGVLAGDAQGRVNLLFLLVLFAFLPIAGLLLSLVLLLKGGGKGLSGWILDLPVWPRHLTGALPRLQVLHGREPWLFYQTQVLSLSFSIGCLLLYLLLLLGSDITFVWRSTLLEPEDLLPALQLIAAPWQFWSAAQASLELIEQTRDYRLEPLGMQTPVVGLWWQYILAAQLCYNLFPRTLMMLIARHTYLQRLHSGAAVSIPGEPEQHWTEKAMQFPLAAIATSIQSPYLILDWVGAPSQCQAQVQQRLGNAESVIDIGPLLPSRIQDLPHMQSVLVLVKSWEPPLAELADKLSEVTSSADKLLLPLDWNEAGIRQPAPAHLDEWRRFAATLPNWQVLQFEDLK